MPLKNKYGLRGKIKCYESRFRDIRDLYLICVHIAEKDKIKYTPRASMKTRFRLCCPYCKQRGFLTTSYLRMSETWRARNHFNVMEFYDPAVVFRPVPKKKRGGYRQSTARPGKFRPLTLSLTKERLKKSDPQNRISIL